MGRGKGEIAKWRREEGEEREKEGRVSTLPINKLPLKLADPGTHSSRDIMTVQAPSTKTTTFWGFLTV